MVKNASYDKETGAIVPEEAGADFDVDEAQRLLDAAAPGETVTVPAQVELPAVTAEELEQVGEAIGVKVKIQREDIFTKMHRI